MLQKPLLSKHSITSAGNTRHFEQPSFLFLIHVFKKKSTLSAQHCESVILKKISKSDLVHLEQRHETHLLVLLSKTIVVIRWY